jgi:hypothetical protein
MEMMEMAPNGVWRVKDISLTQFSKPVLFAIVGAASKNAGRRAVKYIKDELSAVDRVDTGQLRDSWKSEVEVGPTGVTFRVYSDLPPLNQLVPGGYSDRTLADIINEGTGVYGPYGSPIVPHSAKVMKFDWGRKSSGLRGVRNNRQGGGRFENNTMYLPSVQGQPATGYLDRALKRIKITDYVTPF